MEGFVPPTPAISGLNQRRLLRLSSQRRPRAPVSNFQTIEWGTRMVAREHDSGETNSRNGDGDEGELDGIDVPGSFAAWQRPKSARRIRGKANEQKRSLEMSWRFQAQKGGQRPSICEKCKGSGRVECSWCHATGVLMLGDRLMCSIEGQSSCLACENGEVQCKACKGTGKLASWVVPDL